MPFSLAMSTPKHLLALQVVTLLLQVTSQVRDREDEAIALGSTLASVGDSTAGDLNGDNFTMKNGTPIAPADRLPSTAKSDPATLILLLVISFLLCLLGGVTLIRCCFCSQDNAEQQEQQLKQQQLKEQQDKEAELKESIVELQDSVWARSSHASKGDETRNKLKRLDPMFISRQPTSSARVKQSSSDRRRSSLKSRRPSLKRSRQSKRSTEKAKLSDRRKRTGHKRKNKDKHRRRSRSKGKAAASRRASKQRRSDKRRTRSGTKRQIRSDGRSRKRPCKPGSSTLLKESLQMYDDIAKTPEAVKSVSEYFK